MSDLELNVECLFGLAFDIERTNDRPSGYKPAYEDLGAGKALFGDLRLDGFAAALKTGFAKRLVLAGGNEGRYKDELQPINRAMAIRQMLVVDYDIDTARIDWFESRSNTGGNIQIIRDVMAKQGLDISQVALMSNLYHTVRASMDLSAAGLPMRLFAAEGLWLVEGGKHETEGWLRKNDLLRRVGDDPHSERCVEEMAGIADKILGTYKARTDTPVLAPEVIKTKV